MHILQTTTLEIEWNEWRGVCLIYLTPPFFFYLSLPKTFFRSEFFGQFPNKYDILLSPIIFFILNESAKRLTPFLPHSQMRTNKMETDIWKHLPMAWYLTWHLFHCPRIHSGRSLENLYLETNDNCFWHLRLPKPRENPVTVKNKTISQFLLRDWNSLASKGSVDQNVFLINSFRTCQGGSCWEELDNPFWDLGGKLCTDCSQRPFILKRF